MNSASQARPGSKLLVLIVTLIQAPTDHEDAYAGEAQCQIRSYQHTVTDRSASTSEHGADSFQGREMMATHACVYVLCSFADTVPSLITS